MAKTIIGIRDNGSRISVLADEWDDAVKKAEAKGETLVVDENHTPEDGNTFEQSSKKVQKEVTDRQERRAEEVAAQEEDDSE